MGCNAPCSLDTHAFKKMEFQPPEAKKFFSTVRKEMALLATSLPDGIMVKTFEDRMASPYAPVCLCVSTVTGRNLRVEGSGGSSRLNSLF